MVMQANVVHPCCASVITFAVGLMVGPPERYTTRQTCFKTPIERSGLCL
jgi:hypothetical protein